jgi:hypothetical protein
VQLMHPRLGHGRLCLLFCALFLTLANASASAHAHVPPVPVAYQVFQRAPPASCGVALELTGCAFSDYRGQGPTIFVASDNPKVLEHERGHLYDWNALRDRDRGDFRDLFGRIRDDRWRGLPSEWFAEAYARCSFHTPADRETAYGYDPTPRQHLAACRLIWDVEER